MTGFLARDLAIQHLDLASLWTLDLAPLLLAKSVQSPHLYHRDILAGPMDRLVMVVLNLISLGLDLLEMYQESASLNQHPLKKYFIS